MALFSRGPQVPARVRAAAAGRVLAAAPAEDGTWLAGTRDDLVVVPSEPGAVQVLAWERVHRADWDRETATLRVEEVQDYGEPVRVASYVLHEPGALLALVRERVSASVVLQRRVDLERKRGFTVIGRRAPSGRGEIGWAYEFDEGVDPDDPRVRTAAEAALTEARDALGQ